MTNYLQGSGHPLYASYDVALLDLDGVVYIGPDAVPGAPAALSTVRRHGMRVAFVTNNAARTPAAVADHLRELGVQADPAEVVTSAQAAARYLAERLPAGSKILVLGTTGLIEALDGAGLRPVHADEPAVAAVVQGYSPEMNWRLLAEGAVAINRGVQWVATNVDPTVPSPRGPLPGNGSLVAALRLATGVTPTVTGKPDPTMHRESLLRSGASRPIVVGDRLDTDIEGASAVGCPSLLVFSGVTDVRQLLAATPSQRPDHVSASVAGLLERQPATSSTDGGARCGRWVAVVTGQDVRLTVQVRTGTQPAPVPAGSEEPAQQTDGAGSHAADRREPSGDQLDAVRAACAAWWSAGDARAGGSGPGTAPARVDATDDRSAALLQGAGVLYA